MMKTFTSALLQWYQTFGRKDLPWQTPYHPYRVWLSEIMLQQTQVQTVIPYFQNFIKRFPDVNSLANASEDEVLALWSGLGYYSRARNLHKTAMIIADVYQGQFPEDTETLVKLPGIGPSTAAAIASLAFEKASAILDGNVKRVLSRYFLVAGPVDEAQTQKKLWQLANECMPSQQCRDYTQAIMDLGATCCTQKNPNCLQCPVKTNCQAHLHNKVSDYPFKAAKKIRPVKAQQFLLLHRGHELYLEKRPSKGIWGGLWCLPAIEADDDPKQYLSTYYDLDDFSLKPLLQFKHQFTHFQLQIQVLTLEIPSQVNYLQTLPGEWFNKQACSGLGLSKPMSKIIKFWQEN